MENKNAKVAYFNHQPSGCFWYRIKRPMDILENNGVPTLMINLDQDVNMDYVQSLQVYGIYPFSFDKVFKTLKNDGIRIIYDMDDALDLIDTTNPFYYNVKKDAGSQREIFAYADHITVATQELARYARERTTAPITVIPNCYDQKEWNYPRPTRDGIRIGFAGSSTHVEDLLIVLPAICNLQKKYDIRFLIMGFGQDSYEQWLTLFKFSSPPEGIAAINKLEEYMKDITFEWIPYVDFQHYPSTLINMSLDIGLCPLKDTPFNRCRSASKAMEYTLAGALAIASNIPTYSNDPTSVLVDNNWEETIEYYITNPEKRQEKYEEHLAWLRENRDMNTQADLLKSIYLV